MWYDRKTKEVINPHFDGSRMYFIDDETIVYGGISNSWRYDVNTMKKKRFFSKKEQNKIIDMLTKFFIYRKNIFHAIMLLFRVAL